MNVNVGGSAGAAHLGGQIIGGLRVIQRMQGVQVRWSCVCTRCGVSQVCPHSHLMSGWPKCANSNCGRRQERADDWFKNAKKQERLQAAERAKEQQAQIAAKKARADAEAAAKKARADDAAAKKEEAEHKNRVVMFQIASDAIAATMDEYALTSDERAELLQPFAGIGVSEPIPIISEIHSRGNHRASRTAMSGQTIEGAFGGLFTHPKTCEERRARQEKMLRSAERLAKTLRPSAGRAMLDATEIQLFGHLVDGMETREEK